jgi:hypothetical protein
VIRAWQLDQPAAAPNASDALEANWSVASALTGAAAAMVLSANGRLDKADDLCRKMVNCNSRSVADSPHSAGAPTCMAAAAAASVDMAEMAMYIAAARSCADGRGGDLWSRSQADAMAAMEDACILLEQPRESATRHGHGARALVAVANRVALAAWLPVRWRWRTCVPLCRTLAKTCACGAIWLALLRGMPFDGSAHAMEHCAGLLDHLAMRSEQCPGQVVAADLAAQLLTQLARGGASGELVQRIATALER